MIRTLLAVGLVWVTAAQADQGLVFRAGRWAAVISMDGAAATGPVRYTCRTTDVVLDDHYLATLGARIHATCTNSPITNSGNVASFSSDCRVGAMRVRSTSAFTAAGPDAFTVRVHSHTEGGPVPIPDMDMTNASRRTGACQPGDTKAPD